MRFCAPLLLAIPLSAQTPAFEVASIRPSNSNAASASVCNLLATKPATENVQAPGVTLSLLIIDAYQNDIPRFDLPEWTHAKFDVSVKMPPNTTQDTCRLMLRNLLAERFHMVTAIETREMPTYFLKVAKGGLKLKVVSGPPDDPRAVMRGSSENGLVRNTFTGAPWARIVTFIDGMVGQGRRQGLMEADVVVDETGLNGYYDGQIEYQSIAAAKVDPLVPPPALAIADQLGLILEVRKAPQKFLIIRSSDRTPTEN